jgi:hypothetical protein
MDAGIMVGDSLLEARTTMERLDEIAPGSAVLNTDQIASALGKTGVGGPQTVRNQVAAGKFPLQKKLRKVGGRWVLSKAVFAGWLDGVVEDEPAAPAKRGPGRPRRVAVSEWLAELDASWKRLLEKGRSDLDSAPEILAGTGSIEKKWM